MERRDFLKVTGLALASLVGFKAQAGSKDLWVYWYNNKLDPFMTAANKIEIDKTNIKVIIDDISLVKARSLNKLVFCLAPIYVSMYDGKELFSAKVYVKSYMSNNKRIELLMEKIDV